MKRAFSILLVSALLVPFVLNSCKKAETRPLGVQLYSVRDSMQTDPAGSIEKIGKLGFKFVELYGYHDRKFFGMEPAAFKALVEKNGMSVLGSHTGASMPDSANWDKTMAWWDTCIADHKAVGAKFVIQTWMDSIAYTSLANLKKYCEYFNAVGEKCKAAGLTFGYHNENVEFKELEGQIPFDYLIQNTDSTKVVFELDTWNMTDAGKNPVEYLKKYPGRFILWHVKDEKEMGASGKIDFKAIFNLADFSGVKYYVLEQEAYSTNPFDGLAKSLEYMKKEGFVK